MSCLFPPQSRVGSAREPGKPWSFYGLSRAPRTQALAWLGFVALLPTLLAIFTTCGFFYTLPWALALCALTLFSAEKNRSYLLILLAIFYAFSPALLFIGSGVNP